MDRQDLKKIIDLAYEVEALAGLALRREAVADDLARLIADKCFTAANIAIAWNLDPDDVAVPSFEPETDQVDSDPEIPDEEEDPVVPESDQEEEKYEITPDNDSSEVVMDEEIYEEYPGIDDTEIVDTIDDDYDEPVDESEEEPEDESDADDDDADDKEEEVESVETCAGPDAGRYSPGPVRKKIRPYFSVNDMFRFKRELFSNNNADFNDSLNLVETMESYAEAEDYFYADLQWDSESDDVVEFMSVIARYFN